MVLPSYTSLLDRVPAYVRCVVRRRLKGSVSPRKRNRCRGQNASVSGVLVSEVDIDTNERNLIGTFVSRTQQGTFLPSLRLSKDTGELEDLTRSQGP